MSKGCVACRCDDWPQGHQPRTQADERAAVSASSGPAHPRTSPPSGRGTFSRAPIPTPTASPQTRQGSAERPGRIQRCKPAQALSKRLTLTGWGVRNSWANKLTRSSSSSQR